MGFSLGGLNFASALAGFAERDMELRDQAREDAKKLARDTLNYRAELGMSRRKEKQAELKNAVNKGRNLMQNYGFSMQQIGVLATQGKLDQVADLYDRAQTDPNFKGDLPQPDAVVSIMEEKPIDMPFDQYMRSIIIGEVDTSRTFERDIGAGKEPQDAFFKLTGFDPYSEARSYTEEYERSLGMSADEMSAYAFDGFTPAQAQGAVDITGFKTGQKGARGDVLFGKARNQLADTVANSMNLQSDFSSTGDFLGIRERGQLSNQAAIIIDQAAREVENIVVEKGPEAFGEAVSTVRAKLMDPRYRVDLYNRATGGEGEALPEIALTDGTIKKKTGFMDEETISRINQAQSPQELARIAADISSRPGGGGKDGEADRIRAILRDSSLSLDEKKKRIIGESSAAEPSVEPSENPKVRYDARGRPIEETASVVDKEQVSAARQQLEARGVDTMDKTAVKTAMLAQTKPIVEAQRQEFEGTDREFFQMLGQEYDVLAQNIVDDAQGGLV